MIDGGASKAHFALLIQEHFTGAELKELVANGIQLSRVVDIITKCQQVRACVAMPEQVACARVKAAVGLPAPSK